MSLWVDISYLNQISFRLDGYVLKKEGTDFLANCRCPICGDSQTNKHKKRGYFYDHEGSLFYKCWNCSISFPFDTFLENFDRALHSVYRMEKFKDNVGRSKSSQKPQPEKKEIKAPKKDNFFTGLTKINLLEEDHEAVVYLKKRKIPKKFINDMALAENFFAWAATNTDKFSVSSEKKSKDHPRIVIPWRGEDNKIFGYQARSLHGEEPKYYTILLDETKPKIFGLNMVDYSQRIYVVEGPIDSMFLKNGVAVGSSALFNFDSSGKDAVYCFDNEPRNKEIVNLIEKTVNMGYNVFIPPERYVWKDINDAVEKGGLDQDEIKNIIDGNTFRGMNATVRLNRWKRR